MAFRGTLSRHRTTIASSVALSLAAAGVLAYAISADGYRAHDAQLNDGGIWVTNATDGYYGRINKPIGQLDGALFAKLEASLDIVQDGAAVIGVNASDSVIAPIDPASVEHPEGESALIPGGADVALAGGTLAVGEREQGRVWAIRTTPGVVPSVIPLDAQNKPLVKAGGAAVLTVTAGGTVLVASGAKDTLTTLAPSGAVFAEPETTDVDDLGDAVAITAVGERAVLLDEGRLVVVGGGEAEVPADAVLQQAGPAADSVLLTTGGSLLEVDLDSGDVSTVVDGVGGAPVAPVRLGDCVYGAWSGGKGTVATACGGGESTVAALDGDASNLVFRVNRGEIVLNDRTSGRVWEIDSDEPTRLDNWDDFLRPDKEDEDEQDNEKEDAGDRRPPQAKPDRFGARPGRMTILHPLDNDTAPKGRILAIRSVDADPDTPVTISPDGQTLQIVLPEEGAGVTSFEYYIDDGRAEVSAHATVTVSPRLARANASPHLRDNFSDRTWTVPAGGVLDVPVLPDWRDKQDGDPLSISSAQALGGASSGATARVTAGGRVRFSAPAKGGEVTVEYAVTDGIAEPVPNELTFRVQDPADRQAVAGVAEPDIVAGEVGQPITIRPLGNDLPGSDPVHPESQLEIGGKVASIGGATVRTDLTEGTITLTSAIARSYFLDYDAAYGNAPFAPGRIRVDVRPRQQPPPPPIAMPDTVTLRGQAPTLVDVLANDVDPTGGLLVVQGAEARAGNQLDVAVVDGRWLRLSARQGELVPNPQVVRYTISNGSRAGVQGEVVVTGAPRPADNTPVTEIDRVTVRAGAGVTIPVLDNDFSPAGDALSLISHVAGEEPGQLSVLRQGNAEVPTGQAYVSGRLVRYVAPADLAEPQTFTVRYLATNDAGDSAPGRVEISVVPLDQANNPPEPPTLEGRMVSGDTLKLKLPGSGVDPDGDSVTLVGLGSPVEGGVGAPRYGRIVRFGANSLHYQAYPGSQGTETFAYQVVDSFGALATGTVRVAIVPPGHPQPPLAVNDAMTLEPGRTATIDVLGNDLIAAGDRVEITLIDAPDGASLESPVGPVHIEAPPKVDGRLVEVVYEISNGIDSSRGLITLRAEQPWNNPPVVFDAFGSNEEGDLVSVDVLTSAYDPDGAFEDLEITQVFAPEGVTAEIKGSKISVARGPQPLVVPFRVEDADRGAATASLYVPATGAGPPYVVADGLIKLAEGQSKKFDLSDFVVDPAGGPVKFTLKERIWPSPLGDVSATINGEQSFTVEATDGFTGPGAVTFEVTTGDSVDDEDGIRAVVSVPVQVGDPVPILRCPGDAVEVAQGESLALDIATLCHVWTLDPDAADDLAFEGEWQDQRDGLDVTADGGSVVEVAARGDVRPGTEGVLQVSAAGSDPGEITIRVVKSPPPSLAPIRVADMKAGEKRTINLARFLRAGVSNPEPTVIRVDQITALDITAVKDGASGITLTTGARVDGRAEFRVIMSDVSGNSGPERQVEGRISLDVLDVPDRPLAPVPGRTPRSQEVHLEWRAPAANGAPITAYELRTGNRTQRCGSTSCDFTGLTNGTFYTFQVRAKNAVGWSEWSASSVRARPDEKPDAVRNLRVVASDDHTVTLEWAKPANKTSPIQFYSVTWQGGSARPTQPRYVVRGLDNNLPYTFTVAAKNALDYGPEVSVPGQSIGTPSAPASVTVTPTDPAGDTTAVVVDWPDVDPPNGPGPVRYTVTRDGVALPACTKIVISQCDNTGIAYDGTKYTYAVTATNKDGTGKVSPPTATTWAAVGQPAAWGDWTVVPSGEDNLGRAMWTAPASRGGQSKVQLLVNGVVKQEWPANPRGQEFAEIVRMDQDGVAYTLTLRVCNEQVCGGDSPAKSLQTFGPVGVGALGTTEQSQRIECRWPVNPNGLRVTVYIGGSNRGTIGPGDGMQTVSYEKTGYDQTLDCDLRVVTEDNKRAEVTRSGPTLNSDPPPPTVSVSRGSKCNDANGLPDCNTGGSGTNCVHSSCGFIQITTANFSSGSTTCTIHDNVDGAWATKTIQTNRTVETSAYFGFPARTIWVVCGGRQSPDYNWPDS